MPSGKKRGKKKKAGAGGAGGAGAEADTSNPLYYKTQGNTAFSAGDYTLAITEYGKVRALSIHPTKLKPSSLLHAVPMLF